MFEFSFFDDDTSSNNKPIVHEQKCNDVCFIPESENIWKIFSYICGNKLSLNDIKNLRLVNKEFYKFFTKFLFFSSKKFQEMLNKIESTTNRYDYANLQNWRLIEAQFDDIILLCKSNKDFDKNFRQWLTVSANNILLDTMENSLKKQKISKENNRPKFREGMKKIWHGTVGTLQSTGAIISFPLALLVSPILLRERGSDTPIRSKIFELGSTPFIKCVLGAKDSFDYANKPNVRNYDRYIEDQEICNCISRISQRIDNELSIIE